MCLAIPGRLTAVDGANAVADFGGVGRKVCLDLVPEAQLGDFVLVHAGFAIQRLDAAEAADLLSLFQEMAELAAAETETPE